MRPGADGQLRCIWTGSFTDAGAPVRSATVLDVELFVVALRQLRRQVVQGLHSLLCTARLEENAAWWRLFCQWCRWLSPASCSVIVCDAMLCIMVKRCTAAVWLRVLVKVSAWRSTGSKSRCLEVNRVKTAAFDWGWLRLLFVHLCLLATATLRVGHHMLTCMLGAPFSRV